MTLTVNFLLAGTALFGGTKVALRQANLLARRGHHVRVLSLEEPPDWLELETEFRHVTGFGTEPLPPADVHVATFWWTIAPAAAAVTGQAVHYCQGFEASYTHNRADHGAILEAYALPLPAMTVSAHLARLLGERFARPARVVPQPLEPWFHAPAERRLEPPAGRPPRILVVSPFEIDWKGVRTALEAVRTLRADGFACHLVRLSQWPLGEAERRLLVADEYHTALQPREVASLVAGCDLLLAPSWEQEGFGLPVLEAMACGVPAVVSDIACYREFARGARRVPAGDAPAFAAAARELLTAPAAWREASRLGRAAAAGFTDERSANAAEDVLRWVANGSWRGERVPKRGAGA